jgi:hypothetical protein
MTMEVHRICVMPWSTGSLPADQVKHMCRLPAGHGGPVHECTCGAVNHIREL